MNEQAEYWLAFAEKDLKTIEKIIEERDLTNVVAFHSHQCIEKSLKALIFVKIQSVPKVHNLLQLYGTVRKFLKLDVDIKALELISETYIDSRYPGEIGMVPEGLPSIQKARQFYDEAKSIYIQTKTKIKQLEDKK